MNKRLVVRLLATMVTIGLAGSAHAISATGGIVRNHNGLTGELWSAWLLLNDGQTGNLYTVPAGKLLAVTNFCMINPANGASNAKVELVGTSGGRLAILQGNRDCISFNPGVAIAAGNTLQCLNTSAISSVNGCTVSGVLMDQ